MWKMVQNSVYYGMRVSKFEINFSLECMSITGNKDWKLGATRLGVGGSPQSGTKSGVRWKENYATTEEEHLRELW